jgi:hypothetical protein
MTETTSTGWGAAVAASERQRLSLRRSIVPHATRLRTAYLALSAGLQRLASYPLQSQHTTPVQRHLPPVSPSQYEHVLSRSCCTVL